jgi:hypothetical protein
MMCRHSSDSQTPSFGRALSPAEAIGAAGAPPWSTTDHSTLVHKRVVSGSDRSQLSRSTASFCFAMSMVWFVKRRSTGCSATY